MRRNLFSWLLYDAGNSFIEAAIGGMYLAQWVIIDNKFDDIWYGGTFAIATLLILITSPFLGAWSDKLGRRHPFIKVSTIFMIVFTALVLVVPLLGIHIKAKVFLILALALVIQYFFQISLIFYNTLLKKLATKNNMGRMSGLGQAFNNGGWIVAVGIMLPFSSGSIPFLSSFGRLGVFLPAFIIFIFLSAPLLFLYKEEYSSDETSNMSSGTLDIYKRAISGLKELLTTNKNGFVFLLAFCFVSDAILTIGLYFAVLMEVIYKIPDTQKFTIMVAMAFSQILGGYILGKVSDRTGPKKVAVIACLVLASVFSLVALSSQVYALYILAFVGGVGWAAFYVTTRVWLIRLSPEARLGEYFSFYTMFQRFSSVIGPLLWGATTLLLKDYGSLKYRGAVLMLALLSLIGAFLFSFVKEKKSGVDNISY